MRFGRILCLSLCVLGTALASSCSEDGATRRPQKGDKRKTTDPVTGKELPDYNDPHTKEKEGLPDPFEGMLHGQEQNDALCGRMKSKEDTDPQFNAVTSFLCVKKLPITGITDLQNSFGLDFKKPNSDGNNGSNTNPAFAFSAHSSSLVARSVSAINPRSFLFSPPQGQPTKIPGFVVMAFVRGEQFVEIAAQSPKGDNRLSFYLIKYEQACGATCTSTDLLTPNTERGWTSLTVYDDEDLKNTVLDCRHCHQPNGPSSPMMLRMQEFEDPWTHWFRSDRPGGLTLLQDYFRAHGQDESYGGIPGALIDKADGRALEDLVKGQGFTQQPNTFDSKTIEAEIQQSQVLEPEINTPAGSSATWDALFNNAYVGNFIPVPYHDVKVTDPNNLQFATDKYQVFKSSGSLDADIRRIFLQDALEEMAMVPRLGASGREILVQTCSQCHNPRLDQTLSRAKFDVTALGSMSRSEKDLAIQRLMLPASNRLHMPPAFLRTLPDDARSAAVDELKK